MKLLWDFWILHTIIREGCYYTRNFCCRYKLFKCMPSKNSSFFEDFKFLLCMSKLRNSICNIVISRHEVCWCVPSALLLAARLCYVRGGRSVTIINVNTVTVVGPHRNIKMRTGPIFYNNSSLCTDVSCRQLFNSSKKSWIIIATTSKEKTQIVLKKRLEFCPANPRSCAGAGVTGWWWLVAERIESECNDIVNDELCLQLMDW